MSSACDAAKISAPRLEFAMRRCLQLLQSSKYAGETDDHAGLHASFVLPVNQMSMPLCPYREVGAKDASLIPMMRRCAIVLANGNNNKLGMRLSYVSIALA